MPAHLQLVPGPLQLALIEDTGEIKRRPEGRGNRNPIDLIDFVGRQLRLAAGDARAPGTRSTGAADLEPGEAGWKQAPDDPGGSVTQNCPWPTRQDRRHPSSLTRKAPNADDVDAPMDLVEIATLQSPSNRFTSQSQRKQLTPCHHTVLATRELPNCGVPRSMRQFDVYRPLK